VHSNPERPTPLLPDEPARLAVRLREVCVAVESNWLKRDLAGEPDPAVRLDGLVKRFGDVIAVAGIDLEIADGEFFSMLGPSGSGKTSTLRMIAGFEAPTEGRSFPVGSDEAAVELSAGEGFELPPGTRHAAIVGPAGCTCVEGHRG